MKSFKYIIMAAAVSLSLSSCMNGDDSLFNDDWKDINNTVAPYGNNNLTDENVITIAALKAKADYAKVISDNKYAKIEEDIKIKGRIVGNDLAGNIYKQIFVQDATGAIIVGINKAGLSGYMAEGQEILIDLKDLYSGGYGGMAQIGSPYNGGIGRMAESIWMNHFKLSNDIDPTQMKPIEFTTNSVKDESLLGKLVVLKNVTLKNADGNQTFITGKRESSTSNYYHQEIDGFPSSVVIRTSSYADFAAMKLPYDTVKKEKVACDIIGVASKYNDTWQIMIRKTSDIAAAGSVEAGEEGGTDTPSGEAQGDGTLANPFNAVAANAVAGALEQGSTSAEDYYIRGKISEIKFTFDAEHGTATFFISDDGTTANQFQVYSALYLGNRNWAEGDTQISLGDEVIVYGKLTNFKGTPETASKKAYLYSLNGKTE